MAFWIGRPPASKHTPTLTHTRIHPRLPWIPIFTRAQILSQGNQDISAADLYAEHEYSWGLFTPAFLRKLTAFKAQPEVKL